MPDRTGEHFGNYRLVRLLGQGGYAEVYLGQHLRLNQQAAIKVLHAHLTEEVTRQAHATYYLHFAEEAEPQLDGPMQAVWLEKLEREHDNLRAALEWGLSQGEVGQSREMALRLGGALLQYWAMHGYYREGRSFLEQALTGSTGVATSVRTKALIAAAQLTLDQGEHARAAMLAEESLTLGRQLGDTRSIAFSLNLLGVIAWTRGDLAAVRSLNEEALALSREAGDKDSTAWSLYDLAIADSIQGEYNRAHALLEESLTLFREIGNTRGIADVLFQLAYILFVSRGDQATVNSLLEECFMLSKAAGHKGGIASYFSLSGQLALEQGRAAEARSLAEESLGLFSELGHRSGIADSLAFLARVEAHQGDYAAAHARYKKSLARASEVGDKLLIVFCLEGLAGVITTEGNPAWAAQLWGAAEALRQSMGAPIPPLMRPIYEQAVATAHSQLGGQVFAALWAEGRLLTPQQALAARGQETISKILPANQRPAAPMKTAPTSPSGLTAREVEVLRLLAQGLTDTQIADQLVISPRTVNTHLTSIYGKIQVSSRSGATRYAIEHHLV